MPGLERKPDPAAAEHIRAVIRDARNWGLDVYLNFSGINYPNPLIASHPHLRATAPPGADRMYRPPTAGGASTLYTRVGVKPNLCVSEAKTWEFVQGHVREIAELFPEIDRSAKMADRGLERVAPTPANIARLIAEKEEAFQLAERGLALVEHARGRISQRHLDGLKASFTLARELARIYRPELEALMLYFQFESTLSEVDRERLRGPVLNAAGRLGAAVKEAERNLSQVDARQMCEDLGMDWRAFKSNKGLFSQDPTVTALDKNLALPYALQFADDIEKLMDYVPASVFGYY